MNAVLELIARRFAGQGPEAAATASMIRYLPGNTLLTLDSPHSGVDYPDDFDFACDFAELRSAEDTHVEKLFDFAPELGVSWVEALFPRSYLDVNRNVDEIDVEMLDEPWPGAVQTDPKALAKVRLGKGLVWRRTDSGLAIYDRQLTVSEVERRIDRCWRPYHAALADAVDRACARNGYSVHINCHSMPSVASSHATEFPGLVHPDFVIGDRDGSTASQHVADVIRTHLRALGYSVAYNHPYKGVEIVRRHGAPGRHRHSIQLEINRALYMNERTFLPIERFDLVRSHLRSLVARLLDIKQDSLG